MKLEESYNLSRDKWFDRIKGECRSQAIKGLCLAAMILLVFIVIKVTWPDSELRVVTICLTFVGCLASGWMVVNNLWFLLRLDRLDTPEQLLHWYQRRFNYDRTAAYLAMLGVIIFDPILWFDIFNFDWTLIVLRLAPEVGIIALLIFSYFNDDTLDKFITRRDEEIFDQLEELVEEK